MSPTNTCSRWSRASVILCTITTMFALAQLLFWANGIFSTGGLEPYVRRDTDFRAFLTGGLMVAEGAGSQLYDLTAQHLFQARVVAPYYSLGPNTTLPNLHLPFESIFAAPLMGLPYGVSYLLWVLLDLLALGGALRCLAGVTPLPTPGRWTMVAAAVSYHPFQRSLWLGQGTPLVLLGLCATYAALKQGREYRAGLALVLVALKPQLLPVVCVLLLLHRRWRPLLVQAAVLLLLSIAVMPFLGAHWPLDYARLLLDATNWGPNLGEHLAQMHNWRAVAQHLVGSTVPQLARPLALSLSLASFGLLLGSWWYTQRKSAGGGTQPAAIPDFLWIIAVLITILSAQHLYLHDLTLLIFPAWLLVAKYSRKPATRRTYAWFILLWIGYLLPYLAFFLVATPQFAIIPSVLYMALITLLIARESSSRQASCDRSAT